MASLRCRPRRGLASNSTSRPSTGFALHDGAFRMKIASIATGIVALPNDEPLAGFSENPNATNPIVSLRVRTDEGIKELGVTYFGGRLTNTLRHAVDDLGALAIGEDPLRVEAVAAKLVAAAGSTGPGGIL